MKGQTKRTIIAVAGMDGTITPDQLKKALAALAGETAQHVPAAQAPLDRLLSVAECASVLSVSQKTVLRYCKAGHLRRVIRRGGIRATGIAESSVRAFISGEEAT